MAESPQIGAGTSLSYCTTSNGSFTPLAKITGFTPAKTSVAKVAIDCFDNARLTNGLPVEDSIPGWVSPGTWGVKLEYLKTQFGVLRGLLGTQYFWKVIKADGSGYTFSGYIMEVGEEIPLKESMTVDITIQINGASIATFAAVQS